MTKKCKRAYWFLAILQVILNIGPLTYYIIKSYVEATLTREKVALSMFVLIVAILTVVAIANHVVLRSRLWLLLIGLYLCLDSILTPLLMIACCQVVDELIVSPLKKHYHERLTINKEIDRRA